MSEGICCINIFFHCFFVYPFRSIILIREHKLKLLNKQKATREVEAALARARWMAGGSPRDRERGKSIATVIIH